jgi:hypothetical protein
MAGGNEGLPAGWMVAFPGPAGLRWLERLETGLERVGGQAVGYQDRRKKPDMNFSRFRCLLVVLFVPWLVQAQTVNSGSNGSDGAFNPTTNTVINMADHPDGIYHYTSVNIPTGVNVSFIPNARNTPVVWLVQSNVVIGGVVDVSGKNGAGAIGGSGGPGAGAGGSAGSAPTAGQGPGGGGAGGGEGGGGSFGTAGGMKGGCSSCGMAGHVYGNQFLVPMLAGSGGGGGVGSNAGGGGGGGLLIVASGSIVLNGHIAAWGGSGAFVAGWGHTGTGGSGGGVRLVAQRFSGIGSIDASGGTERTGILYGGVGRIRIDVIESSFGGGFSGSFTQGFQPIILPGARQGIQLAIASVAGGSVPANPSSSLANPAVTVPAQQSGFVPVVVQCFNVPLNTPITVTARPANGATVSATGLNSSGTTAASTATVNLNLPRGSGILMAKATVAVAPVGPGGQENPRTLRSAHQGAAIGVSEGAAQLANLPLSVTGLTTDGERIAAVDVEATLGGGSRTVYVTESGKRLPAPSGK